MNCKYTNLQKDQIEKYILPFIPSNKRGFPSSFDRCDLLGCIVHKLKTGCQWKFLFVDIQSVKPLFSWQTVYYYYRKWCKHKVFETMYYTYLEIQKDKLDTEKLNLDGTHSLVKKAAQSVAYQHRKKAKTSNILIMTDGRGIPIAIGGVLCGNHHDLYNIVSQYSQMIKRIKQCRICTDNSIQNADKGFDSKALRRAIRRRKMIPDIKQNIRNRKAKKRGRKPFLIQDVYNKRFVIRIDVFGFFPNIASKQIFWFGRCISQTQNNNRNTCVAFGIVYPFERMICKTNFNFIKNKMFTQ